MLYDYAKGVRIYIAAIGESCKSLQSYNLTGRAFCASAARASIVIFIYSKRTGTDDLMILTQEKRPRGRPRGLEHGDDAKEKMRAAWAERKRLMADGQLLREMLEKRDAAEGE